MSRKQMTNGQRMIRAPRKRDAIHSQPGNHEAMIAGSRQQCCHQKFLIPVVLMRWNLSSGMIVSFSLQHAPVLLDDAFVFRVSSEIIPLVRVALVIVEFL